MSKILLIAKKELKDIFDQPAAYVLMIIFLAINSYFYFKSAYLTEIASMMPLFELLPWMLMLFVPAVTMRSIASEKREGTLEILLTRPLGISHIILGKVLGNFSFTSLAALATLTIPISLSLGGGLDYGVVAAQYTGTLLMILAFTSIGLFASALTQNQTIAFIIAVTINFIFLITGLSLVNSALPAILAAAASAVSIQEHFNGITRGVLDLRDLLYFLTIATIFIALAHILITRGRLNKHRKTSQNIKLYVFILIVGLLVANFFASNVMARIDMTADKTYSISAKSTEVARGLKKNVNVNVYASDQLPPEAHITFEDIKYTLKSIARQSNGKIAVAVKNVDKDDKSRFEANLAGIQPVNFNTIRKDEFQIKQGFLGLVVELGEKKEVIPFIESTTNFEYQLLSLINKVAQENKPKVGYLTGHQEKGLSAEYGLFSSEASRHYDIEEFSVKRDSPEIPEKYRTIIIAGPQKWIGSSTQKVIAEFIKKGNSAFILMEGLEMDQSQYSIKRNMNAVMNTFYKDLGVTADEDLLHDLRSNENVSVGQGQEGLSTPYPVWLRTLVPENNQITQDVGSILLPWASSIKLDKEKTRDSKVSLLYSTSPYTKSEKGTYTLSVNNDMAENTKNLKRYDTAIGISYPSGGRLIFVSDSDLLVDSFAGSNPENLVFGLNALDWLTQEKGFSAIRSKKASQSRLLFSSDKVRSAVKYSNMLGLPVLISMLGLGHLGRRRMRMKATYDSK